MSHTRTLSKSDFKTAQDCPSKLYFKKMKFPNTMQDNPYLQLLAEGGYAVGKLATLLYPGGTDLGAIGDPVRSLEMTKELLSKEDAIIYEATIRHENYLIRVDILVKRGNVLELIEVKSKSYDSANPNMVGARGGIASGWRPYVEDVAFQTMVARLAYPDMKVEPYLLVPDKSQTTQIDNLNSQFVIKELPSTGSFKGYDVEFIGDVDALLKDNLLVKLPMAEFVDPMLPTLANAAAEYAASLNPELKRIVVAPTMQCNKCEYRNATSDPEKDGFSMCWGSLAKVLPSILDIYNGGHYKKALNEAIAAGKIDFKEINVDAFNNADGTLGRGMRSVWQLTNRDTEVIKPELRDSVRGWEYPLHFIDFETSRMALPYHKGMRPFEQIAFQWSCHTVHADGRIEHKEWINTEDAFPSFEFARTLRDAIGNTGTPLMWSHHERSTLRDIAFQQDHRGHLDEELAEWLRHLAGNKTKGDDGRFVDMDKLARTGYFHPNTSAKTSIKFTLPAVLQECKSPRVEQWLRTFAPQVDLFDRVEIKVVNPYKKLPAVQLIDNYHVNEGTAAMRAYQDMMYGLARNNPEVKAALRDALLKYCKLDTLAMVIIWEHWRGVTQSEVKEKVQ